MSDGVQRRSSARRCAVPNRMILRFMGSLGSRRTEATVVNISLSGALIVTKERPTLHQSLWITMVSPVSSGWIEAVPVRFDGDDQVALNFREPDGCGSHFLWAATMAMDMSQLRDSQGPSSTLD
jgi:PilZ domain